MSIYLHLIEIDSTPSTSQATADSTPNKTQQPAPGSCPATPAKPVRKMFQIPSEHLPWMVPWLEQHYKKRSKEWSQSYRI